MMAVRGIGRHNPIEPVPYGRLHPGSFVHDCLDKPDALVYMCLNVGDGDCQVLLLPAHGGAPRRIIIVDVASGRKLSNLLKALEAARVIGTREKEQGRLIPLIVATHAHHDHIAGVGNLIRTYAEMIDDVWEPGLYFPGGANLDMLQALAEHTDIGHHQPASGTSRFIDDVRVTVLAPSIVLKGRYETTGVLDNNSSIAIRVEFPVPRIEQRDGERVLITPPDTQSLVLGADAQTTSWGKVMDDFPEYVVRRNAKMARAIRVVVGRDPLRALVFKVPHHASRRGLSFELLERIKAAFLIVSCAERSRHGFPHELTILAMRQARELALGARAFPGLPASHWELGIHYTADTTDANSRTFVPLGTIALVIPPQDPRTVRVWRFLDAPADDVDLDSARRFT